MFLFFFFNDTATTEIYTLSLHDALPIFSALSPGDPGRRRVRTSELQRRRPEPAQASASIPLRRCASVRDSSRSEEHTSELQSRQYLVCRLLLEKKKIEISQSSTNIFARL